MAALSTDKVAEFLLEGDFLLTALEFYAELIETGNDSELLEDFFTENANLSEDNLYRVGPGRRSRSSSCISYPSTVESSVADQTRYHDYSRPEVEQFCRQKDERIAVLEFELREARDNIANLNSRIADYINDDIKNDSCYGDALEDAASLPNGDINTSQDRSTHNHLHNRSLDVHSVAGEDATMDSAKEYERFTLNFLVNSYLNSNDYKLSGITFSEEAHEKNGHDLENWESFGLAFPKPHYTLLGLLRSHTMAAKTLSRSGSVSSFKGEQTPSGQNNATAPEILIRHASESSQSSYAVRNEKSSGMGSVVSSVSGYRAGGTGTVQGREQEGMGNIESLAANGYGGSLLGGDGSSVGVGRKFSIGSLQSDVMSAGDLLDRNTGFNTIEEEAMSGSMQDPGSRKGDISIENYEALVVEVAALQEKNDCLRKELLSLRERSGEEEHLAFEALKDEDLCVTDRERKFKDDLVMFVKSLMADRKVEVSTKAVKELESISSSKSFSAIDILGRTIEEIVANTLANKREELLPILLLVIQNHKDSEVRVKVTRMLLNFVKRPNIMQIKIFLLAIQVFAPTIEPHQLEREFLDIVIEENESACAEKKTLIAFLVGGVIPHIQPVARETKVLGLLESLSQDKSEEVRESAFGTSAFLLCHLDNHMDLFRQHLSMLYSGFLDPCKEVRSCCRVRFLPSFAVWALHLNCIESEFVDRTVGALENLLYVNGSANEGSMATVCGEGDIKRVEAYCSILENSARFWLVACLLSAPFGHFDISVKKLADEDVKKSSIVLSSDDVMCLLGGTKKQRVLKNHFNDFIQMMSSESGKDSVKSWFAYDWLKDNCLPRLVAFASDVEWELGRGKCTIALTKLVRSICVVYGPVFTERIVRPLFTGIINAMLTTTDYSELTRTQSVRAHLLPIYFGGILTSQTECQGDICDMLDYSKEVREALHAFSVTIGLEENNWGMQHSVYLRASVSMICQNAPEYASSLIEMLRELVVHQVHQVRMCTAMVGDCLVPYADEQEMSSHLLPVLITLSSDPVLMVKLKSIGSFFSIIRNLKPEKDKPDGGSNRVLERVRMQLQSFAENKEGKLIVELLKQISDSCGDIAKVYRGTIICELLHNVCKTHKERYAEYIDLFEKKPEESSTARVASKASSKISQSEKPTGSRRGSEIVFDTPLKDNADRNEADASVNKWYDSDDDLDDDIQVHTSNPNVNVDALNASDFEQRKVLERKEIRDIGIRLLDTFAVLCDTEISEDKLTEHVVPALNLLLNVVTEMDKPLNITSRIDQIKTLTSGCEKKIELKTNPHGNEVGETSITRSKIMSFFSKAHHGSSSTGSVDKDKDKVDGGDNAEDGTGGTNSVGGGAGAGKEEAAAPVKKSKWGSYFSRKR
eukprot:Nk52_evm54s224 gene=Nk52_evmTU54s224